MGARRGGEAEALHRRLKRAGVLLAVDAVEEEYAQAVSHLSLTDISKHSVHSAALALRPGRELMQLAHQLEKNLGLRGRRAGAE